LDLRISITRAFSRVTSQCYWSRKRHQKWLSAHIRAGVDWVAQEYIHM
jgi:Leu/Phe-tRNA-protein transferase